MFLKLLQNSQKKHLCRSLILIKMRAKGFTFEGVSPNFEEHCSVEPMRTLLNFANKIVETHTCARYCMLAEN